MCHHFHRVSWEERAGDEAADDADAETDEHWQPDAFDDEPAEDVEVLTDGGE